MMSHLPHVVIVAIMAAIMQVTLAAPTIDLNAIDSDKFGVKKDMDLLGRQEFWHGLENVTIKFGFHKDAKMVWETMQNHTTMLQDVYERLTAMRQAAEKKEKFLLQLIDNVDEKLQPILLAQKKEADDDIQALKEQIKSVQILLQDQITENEDAIEDIHGALMNEVAKLNVSINANQAASDAADSDHTQEIEALEKLLRQTNESLTKKLEDARSDISDSIQEKTDALEDSIEEACDDGEDMNETMSANSNMIATMQDNIDTLEQKFSELEKDKTGIESKLHNMERTVGNVTNVLNSRHICPSGYDYVKQHDRCLMFVKTEESHENAEDECQKHFSRGHIAYVESQAVSDYLMEQRKTDKRDKEDANPWIALHYHTQEKAWHWENAGLDFSENSWTNWDAGQPKLDNGNCVKLMENGKWRTKSCHSRETAWCQATPAHVDTLVKQVNKPKIVYN